MKQHEVSLGKTEEIKQLQREKEGLELDIDIIKQLKVEIKLMKCETKHLTLLLLFKVNAEFKLKRLQDG